MPNKHDRFGTKLWILAESATSYLVKLYIYEGKIFDLATGNGTGYVVLCLMNIASLYMKGHRLFRDNLFTTNLTKYFYESGTHITGTFPKLKPKVLERIYFHQQHYLSMTFMQKNPQLKPVLMLLTEEKDRRWSRSHFSKCCGYV